LGSTGEPETILTSRAGTLAKEEEEEAMPRPPFKSGTHRSSRSAPAGIVEPPTSVEERVKPMAPEDADGAGGQKALRKNTWTDFSTSDPLYALLGQVAEEKVVDDGHLQEAILQQYLETLIVQKAAKKPKDWIEVWAAMGIPIDCQTKVLTEIIAFGLQTSPEGGLGQVLAELIKGHRVKSKAVEEAVQATLTGGEDRAGVLREMLFIVFPKGPNSDWGWSRVGWGWQEWWKITEKTIGCLEPTSAFDELGLLLEKIEAAGGKPLIEPSLV